MTEDNNPKNPSKKSDDLPSVESSMGEGKIGTETEKMEEASNTLFPKKNFLFPSKSKPKINGHSSKIHTDNHGDTDVNTHTQTHTNAPSVPIPPLNKDIDTHEAVHNLEKKGISESISTHEKQMPIVSHIPSEINISSHNEDSHKENHAPKEAPGVSSPTEPSSPIAPSSQDRSPSVIPQPSLKFAYNMKHVKKRLPGLGRPVSLEEGAPPKGSKISIFVIFMMIAAFLLWASITPITEVAVAPGQIIPSSFVKTIQHLEGGIIKDIFVEDGMEVKEGQILLTLDEASPKSELEQMQVREAALRIRAERLRSVGMNQDPNFSNFGTQYQELINDQMAIFHMQMKNRTDQREIIFKQIEQKKSVLAMQEGRLKDLDHRVSGLKEQRDVLKGLYDKRLKTGTEYRGAEDILAEVLVDLNQVKNSFQETNQAVSELESRLLELDTRLRNDALIELGNITAEIAQVTESKIKLTDRVARLSIKAPSAGIVKGLKNTTLRGVIQPGAEILQIVPKEHMEVEARVQPKDMGKLREGQHVLVKVSAYDYPRFGGIEGNVKSISATTFIDEKNNPYYRVFVSLNKNYVGGQKTENHISPGMTVQSDIETDKKTLISYLFKPIYVALHESFRER